MPLKIGVVGATGFVGSFACAELLSRGHHVIGFARKPEALGSHPLFTPKFLDINTAKSSTLLELFSGLDVLIHAYGPHAAHNGQVAMMFIEAARKSVLAARKAKVNYFIMVGGTGSLHLPGQTIETCIDDDDWWIAYRRGMADSDAHLAYMGERFGPAAENAFRAYRDARAAREAGTSNSETQKVIESMEKIDPSNDPTIEFIKACRATYLFFEGNTSFRWSFVSPPALFRSGKRTGKYQVMVDYIPITGDQKDGTNLNGRLGGIVSADLAVALADECEKQSHLGQHWSPYADISDQTPAPVFVRLDAIPT